MSKIKSLLTINKSKSTAVKIETIGDLKQALEQASERRLKRDYIITELEISVLSIISGYIVLKLAAYLSTLI